MKKLLKDEGENMIDIVYTNNKEVIALLWTSWLSFIAWLFGGFDLLVKVLATLMIFDFVTGVLVGYRNENVNSKRAYLGFRKKIMIWVIVCGSSLMSYILGNWVRDSTAIFYIAVEFISIFENAAKLGVPLPPKLKKALEQCQEEKNIKLNEK